MLNLKQTIGAAKFTLKKHAPEILLGVGITGMVGSTVLACKATLKLNDVLEERTELLGKIDVINDKIEAGELTAEEYTAEDAKKDTLLINAQTVGKLIRLYGPAVTLAGASIACILGSYKIMNKRNVALMAAYKVIEEAFTNYRKRVVKEFGETKDAHFMYGTETVETEETVYSEDGKKKKVKKTKEELVPGANLSGFARVFEAEKSDQKGSWIGSAEWSPIHDYNLQFLLFKEKYFNDLLASKGFVTINEVLEQLGFAPTEAGMVCGWRYKGDGDGYISFRPRGIDGNWTFGKDGDSMILDFNIDGVIFDETAARNESN